MDSADFDVSTSYSLLLNMESGYQSPQLQGIVDSPSAKLQQPFPGTTPMKSASEAVKSPSTSTTVKLEETSEVTANNRSLGEEGLDLDYEELDLEEYDEAADLTRPIEDFPTAQYSVPTLAKEAALEETNGDFFPTADYSVPTLAKEAKTHDSSNNSSPSGESTSSINSGDGWQTRFEELKEYKTKYGNCDVPQKYSPNQRLGSWVNKQRNEYNNREAGKKSQMTYYRIDQLNGIDFRWAEPKGQKLWEKRYNELKEYKEKVRELLCAVLYLGFFRLNSELLRSHTQI
jgi:hypothetical protein